MRAEKITLPYIEHPIYILDLLVGSLPQTPVSLFVFSFYLTPSIS